MPPPLKYATAAIASLITPRPGIEPATAFKSDAQTAASLRHDDTNK